MHSVRIRHAVALIGLMEVTAFSVGCSARTATAPAPATQARPHSTAAVSIVAPAPGAVVAGRCTCGTS